MRPMCAKAQNLGSHHETLQPVGDSAGASQFVTLMNDLLLVE